MSEQADRRDLLKRAIRRIEALEAELNGAGRHAAPLAIVGMGCRFPGGANDPDAFWRGLVQGFDATVEVPPDRWDADAFYDPDPEIPGRTYTRRGAFLAVPVDKFDPQFFGIAPREADAMDPQQRILMEVVWEALEQGGIAPVSLRDTATGVFVGMTAHDWAHMQNPSGDTTGLDVYFGTGTSHSVAAGRIAYVLGLKGPALTVDTACSSSLVAFHVGCQSLRARETRTAIIAGTLLMLGPSGHIVASSGRMLAPDGRCKTFDASADGYGRGEGCGVVVIKRLDDALADGDRVLALVHGTAINQDGRSAGLTAPNALAQEEVIREALRACSIEPQQVGYVEAHGTGTDLGDPIELQALGAVHAKRGENAPPLYVGSVKTNIGHLEAAAGIAGVIKTVLGLQHRVIPPHLNLRTPNPHVPWDDLPVEIPMTATPWPEIDGRRIAGVSSFGFSGTNAHVILEGWSETRPPSTASSAESRTPVLLPLSARSNHALGLLAGGIAARLKEQPDLDVRAVASTLATGRNHWEHRAAIVALDREEALAGLELVAKNGVGPVRGEAAIKRPPRVAFLFTGQGSQRPGMGRELLALEPVFRAEIERCDEILHPLLGRSIKSLLEADPEDAVAADTLQQTRFTQPVLFALEWGLAQLWRSWGIEPAVVAGHSLGEYVAACVAGVLSLEDALRLVAVRGRLIGELAAGGAMAALFADEERVRPYLPEGVSIAAHNAPENTVISGSEPLIEAVLSAASANAIEGRRLAVSHAFHSALMEPMLGAFRKVVSGVRCNAPRIALIANLSGERAAEDMFGPDYWVRHIREPVRFADSVAAIRAGGARVLLELGPAPVLLGLAASCPGATPDELRVPALRPGKDAAAATREALATLYVAGIPIDWAHVAPGRLLPVALPTYPFERMRHWRAVHAAGPTTQRGLHPLLGRPLDSPWLQGHAFEIEIREDHPAWIGEHRVFGRAVFPAAAFLEMARAAAETAKPGCELADVRILEPLIVEGLIHVQVRVDGERLEIASRSAERGPWRTHVTATVAHEVTPRAGDAGLQADADDEDLDVEAFLSRIGAAGVEYRGAFRTLKRLRRGDGVARGELDASRIPVAERRAHGLHPALLDAAFQTCGACFEASQDTVYLPVGIRRYSTRFSGASLDASRLEVRAVLRDGGPGAALLVCDVELCDPDTDRRALVEGLQFQRASAPEAALERRALGWLYDIDWIDAHLQVPTDGAGHWCVVGESSDVEVIAQHLEARGVAVEFRAADSLLESFEGRDGVVWVAPAIQMPAAGDLVVDALRPGLEPLLRLGRAAASGALQGRLCVVTRGAVAVSPADFVSPAAASTWGLAHSIDAEVPGVGCRCIDLPPGEGDNPPPSVADAVLQDSPERRLAFRDGRWKAARLVRHQSLGSGTDSRPGADYRLEIRERGRLDQLAFEADEVAPPQPGEVLIRVAASGLNFRDVLNALGMYPGDAGPLGSECAGRVEAVGDGVNGIQVGDEVMAITPRGFCSRVNASAALTVPIPSGLTAGQAATIPIAFLTADWALNELARLARDERVLIHAATGGVGMAAVQLAQAAGADVFATAGSERKRAALRRMGVRHVYDSRSLEFRERILADTHGEGVHVVLNSLADDFIGASLDVLRMDGRFVEIGKTGVLDPAAVKASHPAVQYHVLYLGEACDREPARVRQRFEKIGAEFASGALRPLPAHRFAVDHAVDAFRFMAQARHLGKIVLFDAADDVDRVHDEAVWITGGLGGLGLAVATDYVNRGCHRVALSGRHAPGDAAKSVIAALREAGADVLILDCDVAQLASVRAAREEIESHGWRIRHLVHAAGVIEDAALAQQDWRHFEAALAPKAAGSWNLHLVTADLPLETFVMFSAGAGVLGSPGQANYAAANVFLDGLARARRSMGLPALSVAWGPWERVGMAARAGFDWSALGLGGISPEAGVLALRRLVRDDAVCTAVLPIDWTRFPVVAADGSPRPFFSVMADVHPAAAADTPTDQWRALLAGAPQRDRRRLLEGLLATEVGRVLGLDPSRPPSRQQGLTDLGVDSLMAVELSNRVGRALGVGLPSTFVFEHPTLEAMASQLLDDLAFKDTSTGNEKSGRAVAESTRDAGDVDTMSADEASAALLDELNQIGY